MTMIPPICPFCATDTMGQHAAQCPNNSMFGGPSVKPVNPGVATAAFVAIAAQQRTDRTVLTVTHSAVGEDIVEPDRGKYKGCPWSVYCVDIQGTAAVFVTWIRYLPD